MNKSIYRLRQINDNTINEIATPYLWFSKPSGFKDTQDSNIQAFFNNCDILKRAIEEILTKDEIAKLYLYLKHIAICCFTDYLPTKNQRMHFPNGGKSICIEYDKNLLKNFFLNSKYALPDCFKSVGYFSDPTFFEKDGEYHIITRKNKDYTLSESVKSLLLNERSFDKFIWTLLTRIDKKFKNQKELRIVLAGRNIVDTDENIKGYKVSIPSETIKKIHIYESTDLNFIERLKSDIDIANKLTFINSQPKIL